MQGTKYNVAKNLLATLIPTIFEEEREGVRSYYDIFSRLLKDRIVFISGPIEEQMASIIIAELLYLEKESSTEPIQFYIMSPGGSIGPGLAIYDTIQYIKAPVITIAMGNVASMASILLAGGAPGRRYALPHADIMIHQPWVPSIEQVNVTQLKITTEFLEKTKEKLIKILAKHTHKTTKAIARDVELDKWLTPKEARDYGLIDEIIKL